MYAFITNIQPYLAFIKDIFTIISLVIAGVVAIIGLRTWRYQLKGTANYDLAKRLLKATYKIRDALQSVRNPFITDGEFSYAMKEKHLDIKPSDDNFHAASVSAVYQLRWQPVVEAYQSLELEAIEAEAVWGSDVRKKTDAFKKNVNSLFVAIDFYLRDIQPNSPRMLDNVSRIDNQRIMYSITDKPEEDAYLVELTANVNVIEELAKPYLVR